MFSDQYYYFNLQSDTDLSKKLSLKVVKTFLDSLQEIEEIDPVSYKNKKDFPWISIGLINAKSLDNWSSNKDIEEVNLISIVGSKNSSTDTYTIESKQSIYLNFLKKLADFLEWEIVEEETEEGIENLVVYSPEKQEKLLPTKPKNH